MHTYITYVADRAATREVEALLDFYGVGRLIVAKELSYDVARDQMVAAFTERGLTAATAKVYVSQGYCIAQLFDTFDAVETFADEECNGSRSLKRIYDKTRDKSAAVVADDVDPEAAKVVTKQSLADVIIANIAHLTSRDDLQRVLDAVMARAAAIKPTIVSSGKAA